MSAFKVVIADYYYETIDEERRALSALDATLEDFHCRTEDEVIAVARGADALIVQFAPVTRRVIGSLDKCRLIVRYAIGVDNIDVGAATERGIWVANVPDYGVDEVSNHAVLLILACARKLATLAADVRNGNWSYTAAKPLRRVDGSVLGLAGFGRIARMVAKKMHPFGVRILAHDPGVAPEEIAAAGAEPADLGTLLAESDFVSVHCPLHAGTRRMFGREQFRAMKKTAFFINTSRGGTVDEEALVEALRAGGIAGAGLDVLEQEPAAKDNPLLSMDNVIVTPHVAWYSAEAMESLQRKAAEEVVRVLSGNPPKNPVNRLS